ncbi:hypothetical protein MAR_016164 [Mya arenaria]|uniref:Uncharacterized protein n=1 Tax=Mya arenaria TaxID=6604 RepID=A0ABY7FJ08_MYAAR|nr:hypothetical protein MAR_016164 [Mya arenaria]
MFVSGVALGAIAHPRPVRSVAADNPCNMVLAEDPMEPSDYISRLTDIQTRSEGIELDAQGIMTQLKESGKVNSFTATFLDEYNFMDTEGMTVSQDKISAAINNQVETLQSHFQFLLQYILHIQDIKGNYTVGTNTEAAKAELLSALDHLENKIQRTACSVVLALRAKGKYILTAMVVSGVALVAIAHPRPVRSVAADNPCNLVLTDDPVKPSDYSIRLADIQTRSEGIELDAQGIKTQRYRKSDRITR